MTSLRIQKLQGPDGILLEITLDRPPINAIDIALSEALSKIFTTAKQNPLIKGVVLRASGKHFCGGGDVKAIYTASCQSLAAAEHILNTEYQAIQDQADCAKEKPVIVLVQGCALGGGFGHVLAATHRVFTPDAQAAMPEASIGFFPDVGSTFQLPLYLGPKLARLCVLSSSPKTWLNATDLKYFGLLDATSPKSDFDALVKSLAHADWRTDPVSDLLKIHDTPIPLPGFWEAISQIKDIDHLLEENTSVKSLQTALNTHPDSRLQRLGTAMQANNAQSKEAINAVMQKPCPSSLPEALKQELGECLTAIARGDFEKGLIEASLIKPKVTSLENTDTMRPKL